MHIAYMQNALNRSADTERFLPLKPRVFLLMLELADGPAHGYRLVQGIRVRSGGTASMDPGLMYRTLARLTKNGLVAECEDRPPADDDARRRYYELTPLGIAVLDAEARRQAAVLNTVRNN